MNAFALFAGDFRCHGIEESLEDFGIAMGDDQTDELAA